MIADTNVVESTHGGKTQQWLPEGSYTDLSRTQTLTLLNQHTVRSNGKTLQSRHNCWYVIVDYIAHTHYPGTGGRRSCERGGFYHKFLVTIS